MDNIVINKNDDGSSSATYETIIELEDGSTAVKTITYKWNNISDMPDEKDLINISRKFSGDSIINKSSVKRVRLPFGVTASVGMVKSPDFDEASILIGGYGMSIPYDQNKNGLERFSFKNVKFKKRKEDEKDFTIGAGASTGVFLRISRKR